MLKRKLFMFFFLTAFIATAGANAQAPTKPTPEAWLKNVGETLIHSLSEGITKNRYVKVKNIALSALNRDEFPRLAMGRHWASFNDDQKRRFSSLFFDYFVVMYASVPMSFSKAKIDVTEKLYSKKDILLKTKVDAGFEATPFVSNKNKSTGAPVEKKQTNTQIEMFVALREIPTGYYIRDIQIEGQSLLLYARQELEKELTRTEFSTDAFLNKIQEKIRSKYMAAEQLSKIGQ